MTARLMADSTTPDVMPSWVSVKAFYVDGDYAASTAQIDAWKGPKVLINVTGDPAHGGDCLDVESGDATPADIPGWYDARHADGARYLTAYSNRSQFTACTAAIGDRDCWRWLATLDGTLAHTFDGHPLAACQNLGAAMSGANFDLSVVFADDWHPEPGIRVAVAEKNRLASIALEVSTKSAGLLHDLRAL